MRFSLMGGTALLAAACASIGRPEGGPRDVTPPVYVRSNPSPGATRVDRPRVDVFFNENIQLEDISNKLVISPAQQQNPSISSNGKRVSVELRDSLKPNTTYTFDFSDAIRDLNEGNILDGYALDFSTGETIDTLKVSGMVFEARNLEPAQGMVVGVYSNLSDTAIRTLPLERVAKTNQYGQFTIRGLKPGVYNIFALEDRNRDWHWDRSENVAFGSFTVSPSVEEVMVADTLASSTGEDSIIARRAWHYLPDDVLLTWFNENYRPQYLRDYERTDRQRVTLKFGAPADSLPDVTVINGPRRGSKLADLSMIETREGLDSLVYWMKDTALVNQDSLMVEARYLKTDTLDRLVMTTDTLKLYMRGIKREKKKSKKEEADTVPPPLPLIEIKSASSSQQELNLPLSIEFSEPVESIDSTMWRLEIAVDTLWKPVAGVALMPDSAMLRRYNLPVAWQPGEKYRLTLDSLAVTGIYGLHNKDYKLEFRTKTPEDYGNITFDVTDLAVAGDSLRLMVELLDQQDKPVQTRPLQPDGSVTFTFLNPATYFARAYIDRNANGKWDTGNLRDSVQPEDVFYYPKKLTLRKNWDIAQEWSIFGTPVDEQKPNEIKKNKPKERDRNMQPGSEDEEYEEDEFGGDGFGGYDPQGAWGNGSQYNNARRGSGTNRGTNRNTNRGGLRSNRDRL